ncbi:MAG TPA: MFS transporter [Ktedonobacterales bacterium]|nr:MFS transporter [Ktedonobacterales bacterium]
MRPLDQRDEHLRQKGAAAPATALSKGLRLGLRANLGQFMLLASITFGVGLVVGAERVVVPELAVRDFHVATFLATLSFIISFGVVKSALNLVAGRLGDRIGRKPLLLAGWLVALPIPFMIIFAPSWGWIVAANVLLGVNQGFAWTMTVTGKIDLVGAKSRGFALGINEFSGYAGVTVGGFIGGVLGGAFGLRVAPFLFVLGVILLSLITVALLVRETLPYTRLETQQRQAQAHEQLAQGTMPTMPTMSTTQTTQTAQAAQAATPLPSLGAIFGLTTWGDRTLASASQAGLVEKFTDTLAWGLFPLYFVQRGLSPAAIGLLVGLYTSSWAMLQIFTGRLTDRIGRKWPIVVGMELAAVGIAIVALSGALAGWVVGALMMGVGMALLYPTLLATVSDVARPRWRGTSLGVYRLWRDSGYAIGGLAIGGLADAFGLLAGFWFCAAIMAASGLVVALLMYETLPTLRRTPPTWERDLRFG